MIKKGIEMKAWATAAATLPILDERFDAETETRAEYRVLLTRLGMDILGQATPLYDATERNRR